MSSPNIEVRNNEAAESHGLFKSFEETRDEGVKGVELDKVELGDGQKSDITDGHRHGHQTHSRKRTDQLSELMKKYKSFIQMIMMTIVLVMIIYNMSRGSSDPSAHLEMLYKFVDPTSLAGIEIKNAKQNTTH